MAIGHHEVGADGLHVHGDNAQALDRIHAKQDVVCPAGLSQALEIHAQACAVLDRTDG